MYYIYVWYIKDTNEIIYVGKGTKKRYLSKQHNSIFKEFIKRYDCESKIIEYFDDEQKAYEREFELVNKFKSEGMCVCNRYIGGCGGGASRNHKMERWTDKEKIKYSKNNVMKSQEQRERMSKNNPMKNKEYAMKNGRLHRKSVTIENKVYDGLVSVANEYCATIQDVYYWIKRGYTPDNKNIYYTNKIDNQKPSQTNTDKSSLEGSTTNE